jgi:hypothetical protein
LTVTVDGRIVTQSQLENAPQVVTVDVPPGETAWARVELWASNTFVPGPNDTRDLGLVVEDVALMVDGGGSIPIPRRTLGIGALATAAFGLALVGGGVPAGAATGLGVLIAASHTWLLSVDGAFLGTYSSRLLQVGLVVLAMSAGIWVTARRRRPRAVGWPLAAILILVLTAMKFSVFVHPAATIADGLFHVHRSEMVQNGQYFFTSVTPNEAAFEFPYPIGLYVIASPLWDFASSESGQVALLRGLVLIADMVAAFLLYLVVQTAWKERTAALMAASFYLLLPVGLQHLCSAALTNVFAQAAFTSAMAVLLLRIGRTGAFASLSVTALLFATAFLSHVSTAVIGVPLVLAVVVGLSLAGRPVERASRQWVVAGLVAAMAIAYFSYYSQFGPVYARTLERVVADIAGTSSELVSSDPATPLQTILLASAGPSPRISERMRDNFGNVALLSAGLGALITLRRRQRDPLTLALWGWFATVVAFALLAVFTPIGMRWNLAAQPLVCCWASMALCTKESQSSWGVKVLMRLAAFAIVINGFRHWMLCLTA